MASEANVSNFSTCISLDNQPCMTRSFLIDLNNDEYNPVLCYHQLMARYNGSCIAFDDSSGRICVPNKL